MNYLVITYSTYIIVTLVLTIWVGRTLYTNGRIFLLDIFNGDETLVNSLNKLLLIGFYLINFGYVLRNLIIRKNIETIAESIESLSLKVGLIIVILGFMHFFNLLILFYFRSRALKSKRVAPITEPIIENG
jgi:hypothetical protein